LEKVAKSIRSDESIQVDPVIDRDTAGVSGSPDIAATIFSKIDEAAVFVCDVSIIQQSDSRSFPNPNVLIDLGYAAKSLGWDRIVLVQNAAYGSLELLPFDLKRRRVILYSLKSEETTDKKKDQKKQLQSILENAIRTIITSIGATVTGDTTLREQCNRLLGSDDRQGWISLIEEHSEPIPDLLVGWKQRWESKVVSELHEKPKKLTYGKRPLLML